MDPRQRLLHQLAVLEPRERMDCMEHLLAEELARILQIPPAQIDYQQNIMHLGVDSLMATELQTALQSKFALQVSAMEFIRGLSIAQLASRMLTGMAADLDALTAQSLAPEEALDTLLEAEMAHLSDAAFEPGKTDIRVQWKPRLDMLLEELRKAPSVLRLSYIADIEDAGLVERRVEAIKRQLTKAWDKKSYPLTIEPEVFWRRGAPAKVPDVRIGPQSK